MVYAENKSADWEGDSLCPHLADKHGAFVDQQDPRIPSGCFTLKFSFCCNEMDLQPRSAAYVRCDYWENAT